MRTKAIVVAAICLPDPFLAPAYVASAGSSSGLGVFRRSGVKPPSLRRRSRMYWISAESAPGW